MNTTRRHPRTPDMTGQRVRMLVVLRQGESKGNCSAWVCRCDCGAETTLRRTELLNPKTVSCGCFGKSKAITHGRSRTPAYARWQAMIRRCHSESDKSYPRYGARGISVCAEWRSSFGVFLRDVGECPPGLTLDRINTFGNYEPGNVRWATHTQQARNTRRNHLHTIDGVSRCLAEWCELLGEPWTTVKKRVAAGNDPFIRQRARRSAA